MYFNYKGVYEKIKFSIYYSVFIKKIVDVIKKEDSYFDENDYKITFNIVNEELGYGYIFFTYFMNGKIETNKVYLATIFNNNVKSITLAGVKESNINKITSVDNDLLFDRTNNFEKNNKKETLYNDVSKMYKIDNDISAKEILNEANEVNINIINKDIKKYEEKYFYDYNNAELSYRLIMDVGKVNNTSDGEMIKIIIN